jgi:hypothetical protein
MVIRMRRIRLWSVGGILLMTFISAATEIQTPQLQLKRKNIPALTRWLTRTWVNGSGVAAQYHTSSEASDLDYDVRLGAKILKYHDGTYARAIHKQYPHVCGPASLAIVLKQLGISDPTRRNTFMSQDVDGTGPRNVDVGYPGSMEHIMWLGYHRHRLEAGNSGWNDGNAGSFMSVGGVLVTKPQPILRPLAIRTKVDFDKTRLNYYAGEHVPMWMWNGAAVGCAHGRDTSTGLTGIMNYFFSGGNNRPWRDAIPLMLDAGTDADVVAFRRIIKGFIDNGISLVCAVEDNNHFNALIGYRGSVSPATEPFYVYTADPLDGWGRSNPANQPLTWRRVDLVRENLNAGKKLFTALLCWNHHAAGGANTQFRRGNWASLVDGQNGNSWLTGSDRQPQKQDPLRDPLHYRDEPRP